MLLIEQNPAVIDRAEILDGIEWHIADACEVSSLREAGLERCDVIVAATGDDEDNLVISLLAKQEFAVPRVIARVNHPKNEWLFNENWGVDISVSTPHLITALVEEAVTRRAPGADPAVRRRSGAARGSDARRRLTGDRPGDQGHGRAAERDDLSRWCATSTS